METSNKIRIAIIAICLLTLSGEALLMRHNSIQLQNQSLSSTQTTDKASGTSPYPVTLKIEPTQILAKSVVVVDLQTGKVLFAKDKDKPMPLASITKVMTALVAARRAGGNSVVKVDAEALAQEGESGLKVGEKWQLKDLINFTLVSSSNDGAAAIANSVVKRGTSTQFSDLMNTEASRLGMTNTHFINETGLDLNEHYGGSYGSATDVAKLLAYTVKSYPELMSDTIQPATTYLSLDKKKHSAINTNKAVSALPGLRASKTGYTDIADGNLAIVVDAGLNQPYVVVVLGSTQEGRFQDVKKLVQALYQTINNPV